MKAITVLLTLIAMSAFCEPKYVHENLYNLIREIFIPGKSVKEKTNKDIREACDGTNPEVILIHSQLKKIAQKLGPEEYIYMVETRNLFTRRCIEFIKSLTDTSLLDLFNTKNNDDSENFQAYAAYSNWKKFLSSYVDNELKLQQDPYNYLLPLLIDEKLDEPEKRGMIKSLLSKKEPVDIRHLLNLNVNVELKNMLMKSIKRYKTQKKALKQAKGLCIIIDNTNLQYVYSAVKALFVYLPHDTEVRKLIASKYGSNQGSSGGSGRREKELYEFYLVFKVCRNLRDKSNLSLQAKRSA